jgi:solute carrier family 25, member 39/40
MDVPHTHPPRRAEEEDGTKEEQTRSGRRREGGSDGRRRVPLSEDLRDRIVAASAGGAMAALFVTPLDVVKARLQAQQNFPRSEIGDAAGTATQTSNAVRQKEGAAATARSAARQSPVVFRNSVDAMFRIARGEGVTGLWRGLQPTLVMAIPATALYFTLYDVGKTRMRAKLSQLTGDPNAGLVAAPLLSGLFARSATAVVSSPLELARTYLQASSTSALRDVAAAVQARGVGVLWTGVIPTLMRDAPFSAVYWSLYEWTKHRVIGPRLETSPTWSSNSTLSRSRRFFIDFASGSSSGMVAAFITTPLDVVKTHMQMDLRGPATRLSNPGVIAALQGVYARHGIKGLFVGAVPRTVRTAPSCAIMISSYEVIMRYFQARREERY